MKTKLLVMLIFASTPAFADTQLGCDVRQFMKPLSSAETPNEIHVTASLDPTSSSAQISFNSDPFDLAYSITTFLPQGQRDIVVSVEDGKSGGQSTSDEYGSFAQVFYENAAAWVSIECTVK